MFRAVYRQIARFFNWINGTGPGERASPEATRDAENASRELAAKAQGQIDKEFFPSGGGGSGVGG